MSTYTQLLLHIVFGTKGREIVLPHAILPRLHAFIGGTVRDEKGTTLAIGGMPDHIHLFVHWRTDDTIANLVRNVKARSSGWLHREFSNMQSFAWQEGYGVFSVSESQRAKVQAYIHGQEAHHATRSYREELVELLRAHGVSYDERYLPHDGE